MSARTHGLPDCLCSDLPHTTRSGEDFMWFKHHAIHILHSPWELLEKENNNNKEKCQKSRTVQRSQEDKKKKLKKICFKRAKFWKCKAPAALCVHSQLYLPFPTTCPAIPMAAEHRTNTPFNKDFSNFFDLGGFSPTQNKNNPSDFLAKSGPHEDSRFEARRTAPILLC